MNETSDMPITGSAGMRGASKSAELTGTAREVDSLKALEDIGQLPDYLVRHYRWAYVWPFAVWFFDHQPIINAILFGNYRRIMNQALRLIDPTRAGKTLQVASVYGELTPTLASHIEDLHVVDVVDAQLRAVRRKLADRGLDATTRRMDAENLSYKAGSFDTVVVFLLLHEMPPEARRNTLREAARVLRPGGRLIVAEYGENRGRHFLHRFWPMRWALTTSEYFLDGFWHTDFDELLKKSAREAGKGVELTEQVDIFSGFYRVMSYRVH